MASMWEAQKRMDLKREELAIEKAKIGQRDRATAVRAVGGIGGLFKTTAFLIIIIVLLFGGGGISLLQEVIKNVPIVVILGVVAILFIFRR